MKTLNKTLIATAVALSCTQAMAAGFQLNSQSATGVGRAISGDAAIGDNASILARNPAGMALFDSAAFSGGVTYADIQVEINDVTGTTPAGPHNFGSIDDAADNKVIPNIFYIQPLSDKVAVGLAAFSNFGTGTDGGDLSNNSITLNPQDPLNTTIPAPVDLLGNTEVLTINFNASLSYRINEMFSVGAGIDAIYGEGTLERDSDITGTLVDVDADGWAFGGIVGGLFELNDDHRWGMSYRFSPSVDVEGDIAASGIEWDQLEVPLADIFQFAGFHQLTHQFALHYTAQYSSWSDFDEITLKDPQVPAGAPVPNEAPLKTYEWDDSWLFSIGATYSLNEHWTLRAGYMHDKGVVDEISSLSIPDSDRNWFTGGFSYHLSPKSDIDFGIAFVRGEDVDVMEESAVYGQIGLPTEINASTRSDAIYYSLQYSYQF